MKKLLLLLTIISHFAFGQNNSPQYNSTAKTTTQSTGVTPKAKGWTLTDTSSGKSPVFKFETGRLKFKSLLVADDTSDFDKILVMKGDSLFQASKSLIGSSAIDTTKVGRIEQGRGTAPIFMYFNGTSWVRNDTSYIPRSGASNITGNLKSNQSSFTAGLSTNNNYITFLNQVNTEIKSASSTSDVRISAYSTSNGFADISVYNPSGGLYDRRMVISGTGNNTPDQSFRIQNGLLYYYSDYRSYMTDDKTIPDIGKVKQLISDSVGTVQSTTLADGKIWIGDGTDTAFPRTLSGDVTVSNLGATSVIPSTETDAGKIEIATQSETNTATDDTRSLTPLKLENKQMSSFVALTGTISNIATTDTYREGIQKLEQRRINTKLVNVRDFGAVGDGVTNDASAINAAITAMSASQTLMFPDGNYFIGSTTIAVNKSINILGSFASITVTGNVPAILITANNVKVEHVRIIGSGRTSGSTLQNGIESDGYYYMTYGHVEFYSLGGSGVYFKNTNVIGLRQGARLNECFFNGNNIGYTADISAEYITSTNCYFQYNNYGVIIRAGNNSFSGGSISDNYTCGIKLEGATLNPLYVNDGHGIFSGVLINHNKNTGAYTSGYNLHIDGITLGYTFSGCHLYDSKIYLKNCVGISFTACHLAFIAIDLEGSLGTMINGCTLYRGYGFTVNNNVSGVQSQTNWVNNRDFSGIAGGYLENVYGGYYNGAVSAGTSIATGDSNIDFTTLYQSTGNNLTQTQYVFYNATNKTIKNFGLGDNKIKINLNLNVSINVAADASKILAILDLYDTDGTTFVGSLAIIPAQVYNESDPSSRQIIFSLQGIYGIEKNKHIRIRIVNNTTYTASIVASIMGANANTNGFNRIVVEGL